MAITATYKGEIIATVDSDESKTLVTQGTWLEDDITIDVNEKHVKAYIAEGPEDQPPSFAQEGDFFITYK